MRAIVLIMVLSACADRATPPDPIAAWEAQGYTRAEAQALYDAFGRGPCIDYTHDNKPC